MYETSTSSPVAEPVAVIASAVGVLAKVEVEAMSPGDLQAMVISLERARRQLDAAVLHAAGELEVRGSTDIEHGLSTGKWLAREALLPATTANRVVRHGHKLRGFPSVDAAFTAGRYGVEHVAVLLGVANDRIAADLDVKATDLADLAQAMRSSRGRSGSGTSLTCSTRTAQNPPTRPTTSSTSIDSTTSPTSMARSTVSRATASRRSSTTPPTACGDERNATPKPPTANWPSRHVRCCEPGHSPSSSASLTPPPAPGRVRRPI
jgi:hypothetical protein